MSILDILVLYQGMSRSQRRAHYKKNRKDIGISWEYITSKLEKK